MQITQEQASRLGMELRRIVPTEGFQTAIEVLRHEYALMVLNSAPNQRELRELAYQQVQALEGLLATINTFVAVAEADLEDDIE